MTNYQKYPRILWEGEACLENSTSTNNNFRLVQVGDETIICEQRLLAPNAMGENCWHREINIYALEAALLHQTKELDRCRNFDGED